MKHATLVASFCVAALTGSAGMASAQAVQLSIRDGRVTLKAEQASVRQILAEWERLGQVKVVGVDRLAAGQPLTLTLTDLPERQALDIVLRTVPGFLAVDRATPVASASRYDRLVLLPRVTAPAVASAAPASAPARTPAPAQARTGAGSRGDGRTRSRRRGAAGRRRRRRRATDAGRAGHQSLSWRERWRPGRQCRSARGGTAVGVQPPETQFDYANPQRYFDQMRQQQQQQQQQRTEPHQPGSSRRCSPAATRPDSRQGRRRRKDRPCTPTAPPGTLGRPGMAPTPAQPRPEAGQFFNPYNLPPNYVPPTDRATTREHRGAGPIEYTCTPAQTSGIVDEPSFDRRSRARGIAVAGEPAPPTDEASRPTGEYAERGDYHRSLDAAWDYLPTYLAKRERVTRWLAAWPRRTTRVLDAGCGEGVIVEEFAGRLAIEGLDPHYSSAHVRRGSLLELPYADGAFERALCLDVLEHLAYTNSRSRSAELHRVLAPGGSLLVSMPNLAHLQSRVHFLLEGRLIRTASEASTPGDRPIAEYLRLFERAGFVLVSRQGIFPTVPGPHRLDSPPTGSTRLAPSRADAALPIPALCFLNLIVLRRG